MCIQFSDNGSTKMEVNGRDTRMVVVDNSNGNIDFIEIKAGIPNSVVTTKLQQFTIELL